MTPSPDVSAGRLFRAHPRHFDANHYVYPVLSRRARGVSIGVNLNVDKCCNFACVYCQVDRRERCGPRPLNPGLLAEELDHAIAMVISGGLFESPPFDAAPAAMRRLSDIALSGDGEPTLHPDFPRAVEVCAEARRRHALDDAKLVLITNASALDEEAVGRALAMLDANNGEIWAKLDAGTEEHYRGVNRSPVTFQRILDNLVQAARQRPIVIQSLFMRVCDRPPDDDELAAYVAQLRRIVAEGGKVKRVQLYTIARRPLESWVTALGDAEIDAIGDRVRRGTGLAVETFHG
jgi:wyosine [tRNA(Phe)-imidazoG37] synthetase (radical SAM superfamily)